VWIETEEPLSPEQAESVLAAASSVRIVETPTPRGAAQTEDVLIGRIRPDRAAEKNGLVLFLACDNLVKGAALNALQIAELLLAPALSGAAG
jgi:aspartate-semialdehyde dehydrogenase